MEKKITRLKINQRPPNTLDVYLDGVAELKVMSSIALALKVGQWLSEEEIENLKTRSLEEKLYQQALGLLSRRPRSEEEIRQRFKRKNVLDEIQNKVVSRLRNANYLDDLDFAKAWVENRLEFRPRSAWAIKAELRKKGVASETIEEALEGFDDEAAVYQAAAVGARKYRNLDWKLFRKRLGAYLARRGFQYHLISPAIDHEWGELAGKEEESEVT
jgi:regulatory protein